MLTYHQSNIALGSTIDLVLVLDTDASTSEEVFKTLWIYIFEFEKRCSRFLPDSELSRFNRAAGSRHPVSMEFRAALLAGQEMARQCDGFYNPFILPALQRAGYVHSMVAAYSQDAVDNYSDRTVTTYEQLEIGDTWARIPYGTAIDLGGCGKGYVGDALATIADHYPHVRGYWFSLGGDIIARGVDAHGGPWRIGIQNTADDADVLAGEVVTGGTKRVAVATSSVLRRKGEHKGKPWHHLIDPRTNMPAQTDIETASVCAETLLVADVYASCAIIAGSLKAASFLKQRNVQGALLQMQQRERMYWGTCKKVMYNEG